MPHQCLGCDTVYDNSSNAIITGCPKCGKKLFLFVKQLPQKQEQIEISTDKKDIILKEVESIAKIEDLKTPIILKLENIRVLGVGKYEIDINQLMKKNKPIIYKIQEGTYVIDLKFLSES